LFFLLGSYPVAIPYFFAFGDAVFSPTAELSGIQQQYFIKKKKRVSRGAFEFLTGKSTAFRTVITIPENRSML